MAKGVRRADEKKMAERTKFVTEIFEKDCENRAINGYASKPLSIPKAQHAYTEKYGVSCNSQKLYKIRGEVFAARGLGEDGFPPPNGVAPTRQLQLPHTQTGVKAPQPLTSANRDEDDPLFHVAIIKISNEVEGLFLRDALKALADRGMIGKNVQVDAIHERYCSVSNYTTP